MTGLKIRGAGCRTRTYDVLSKTAYKTVAIATMRSQHYLVREEGFEPPTFSFDTDALLDIASGFL